MVIPLGKHSIFQSVPLLEARVTTAQTSTAGFNGSSPTTLRTGHSGISKRIHSVAKRAIIEPDFNLIQGEWDPRLEFPGRR